MVSLSFETVSKPELRARAHAMMQEAHNILDILGDERAAVDLLHTAISRLSGEATDDKDTPAGT